jgi:hypothetical protein
MSLSVNATKPRAMNKTTPRLSMAAVAVAAACISPVANAQDPGAGDWQALAIAAIDNPTSVAGQHLSAGTDGLTGSGWNLVSQGEFAPVSTAKAGDSVSAKAAPGPVSTASTQEAGSKSREAPVVSTPVPDIAPTFDLVAGQSLETQLQQWAKRAKWSVVWNATDDFIVPGGHSYGSDFVVAAQSVIDEAAANGAEFRLDIYKGNRSIVIDQSGASE